MVAATPALQGYRLFRPVPTRWQDNDAYGHINNVVYYAWFDTVVNATLVERGLLDITGGASLFLVVASGCEYRSPMSFPETVRAGLRIARLGGSSIRWEIGIFGEGQHSPAAEGHFIHVHVDREQRRPLPIPPAIRAALADLVMDAP